MGEDGLEEMDAAAPAGEDWGRQPTTRLPLPVEFDAVIPVGSRWNYRDTPPAIA